MRSFSLLLLALFGTVASSFMPVAPPSRFVHHRQAEPATIRQFGWLKELGLEKPSWLPDFGGEKKEEPKADETLPEGEGEGDAPAEETTDSDSGSTN